MRKLGVRGQELLKRVSAGWGSAELVDYHTHRVGYGEDPNGNFYIHPDLLNPLYPTQWGRGWIFKKTLNISSWKDPPEKIAECSINTAVSLIKGFKESSGIPLRFCLFSFEKAYFENGDVDLDYSAFHVSNDQVFEDQKRFSEHFFPVVSIHPYRNDALEELEKNYRRGARMIKWLPNSMGIDPSNPKCDPFYSFMEKKGMFLITHTGGELALKSKEHLFLGNPLLLERPLSMGVKVIAAHCGTTGASPQGANFDLWVEMMRRHENLYGDLSCLTQIQRLDKLEKLLAHQELHHRLVNGTDWPWVSFSLTNSTLVLAYKGFITWEERKGLNELFAHNPLLFDFVLKRVIRHPKDKGVKFPDSVFMLHPDLIPYENRVVA